PREMPVLPLEAVLAPGLRRVPVLAVSAGLEFHEDAIVVDERHLIVRQQLSVIGCHLVRHERVVGYARDDVLNRLTDYAYLTGVVGIERPLRPELRVNDSEEEEDASRSCEHGPVNLRRCHKPPPSLWGAARRST